MSMRSRGTSNVGAIVDPCTGWGKLILVGSDKGSRDSATSRSESSSESRPTKRGPVTARRRPNTARAPIKAMPRDRRGLAPEDYLAHALQAKTAAARANWAQRGLAHRGSLEPTTKAMLLRQLYLAFYASGHFQKAYEIALQMVGLGVLEDVVQQDCARAIHAAGDIDLAVGHLRLAARQAPASRAAGQDPRGEGDPEDPPGGGGVGSPAQGALLPGSATRYRPVCDALTPLSVA